MRNKIASPRLRAVYQCGHEGIVTAVSAVEGAKSMDCHNCRNKARLEHEAIHGHNHLCSACASTDPVITGCHCDQQDIYLICTDCRGRDIHSRNKLGLEGGKS